MYTSTNTTNAGEKNELIGSQSGINENTIERQYFSPLSYTFDMYVRVYIEFGWTYFVSFKVNLTINVWEDQDCSARNTSWPLHIYTQSTIFH